MQVSVIPHIRNIGHSVATGVTPVIDFFLITPDEHSVFYEPLERQKDLCDKAQNRPFDEKEDRKRTVIFPNDTDEGTSNSRGFDKTEIKFMASKTKSILPVLIGCIDYQYATSTRRHQTRFVYQIQRSGPTPEDPTPHQHMLHVGPDAQSDAVLIKFPFGGFYAD
jgi:hypothetical protein